MEELINELEALKANLKEVGGLGIMKPFDRCLVKNHPYGVWIPALYGTKNENGRYLTSAGWQRYCIPYEGNEHLIGTTK